MADRNRHVPKSEKKRGPKRKKTNRSPTTPGSGGQYACGKENRARKHPGKSLRIE